METEPTTTSRNDSDDTWQPTKIRFENIEKRFGRVTAIEDISLEIRENEIFALVGDNGAGKSTLMNILCGIHAPTSGTLYLDGDPVVFSNPNGARNAGIETVYQDLALMNDLDVATNIFVEQFPTKGIGPLKWIDWTKTYEKAERILRNRLAKDLDTHAEVEFLSGGERQLVAIGRALAFDPDIVILDEPTSALSVDATRTVHDVINRLKENGRTILVVSHSVQEVLSLADRVGVLYRGRVARVAGSAELNRDRVMELMVTGGAAGGV